MQFLQPQTLEGIAQILDCDYIGDADFPVLGMNEIHVVRPGDIVFVDHPKYYDKALNSAATIVLINKEVECPEGKALLISDDPFRDFNTLTNHFNVATLDAFGAFGCQLLTSAELVVPTQRISPSLATATSRSTESWT